MKKNNFYDFVIDERFSKRFYRACFMMILSLIQICFFMHFALFSNVPKTSFFGINISLFYLVPVIAAIPSFFEHFMLFKNYGNKTLKKIGIFQNKIVGKTFINQNVLIENPIILDLEFYVKKRWYISKNDDILYIKFIRISQNNKIFLVPNSGANINFIRDLNLNFSSS